MEGARAGQRALGLPVNLVQVRPLVLRFGDGSTGSAVGDETPAGDGSGSDDGTGSRDGGDRGRCIAPRRPHNK